MAFKRLREIINACKQLAAEFKMSPKEQETLKKTFTNEGLFELKVQTPQVNHILVKLPFAFSKPPLRCRRLEACIV